MIQKIDFKKIDFDSSQKIKHHFIISNALLIAIGLTCLTALFLLFSCEPAVDPTRQFLIRKGSLCVTDSFGNDAKSEIGIRSQV
jgi:hypothetical protein